MNNIEIRVRNTNRNDKDGDTKFDLGVRPKQPATSPSSPQLDSTNHQTKEELTWR
ncbi:hypothetical protein CsatB_004132 [Cannabis sativa]